MKSIEIELDPFGEAGLVISFDKEKGFEVRMWDLDHQFSEVYEPLESEMVCLKGFIEEALNG